MPRRSRTTSHIPGGLVHVICRFVDGRFILDDLGRGQYLSLLERALRRVDWILISYALMSSHIHLGLIMGDAELRTWAHPVHLRFAQWVNRRLRRTTPTSELSPRALVLRAATVLDVPVELVDRGARTRASVLVRRVALVAGIELGFAAAVMARQMRISESAASRLLSRPHDAGAVKEGVERVLEAISAGAARVP